MTTIVSNRVDSLFKRTEVENRAALILYLTSGFPDEDTTRHLLPVLERAGCDLIELGIPFSDPIADGPVIQRASTVALEAGMTLPKTIEIVRDFRRSSELPLILFGSLNPFLARGLESICGRIAEAGADGILAADLPLDESAEFRELLDRHGMHLITLVAPTTPDARLDAFASECTGFLYLISMKGTTGQQSGVSVDVASYVKRLRAKTDLPLAIGFGISTPAHVRSAVASGADGIVVGTALIREVEAAIADGGDLEQRIGDYVFSLAAELKR